MLPTLDEFLEDVFVYRLSGSYARRATYSIEISNEYRRSGWSRTIVCGDRDQLGVLHLTQCSLVSFEREIQQDVVIWYLRPSRFINTKYFTISGKTHLIALCELLHKNPGLFPRPWQALGVFSVVTERVLAQLADATGYNIVYGLLDCHPAANLVNQLPEYSA